MSATYSVYFENQYGQTQNYAFFCEPPIVTGVTGGAKPYSNVFLSQSIANGGYWSIDITETYYACMRVYHHVTVSRLLSLRILGCGVAPSTLQPDIRITSGNGKLVRLGPGGSKFYFSGNYTIYRY